MTIYSMIRTSSNVEHDAGCVRSDELFLHGPPALVHAIAKAVFAFGTWLWQVTGPWAVGRGLWARAIAWMIVPSRGAVYHGIVLYHNS